jgi:hypothetical protein
VHTLIGGGGQLDWFNTLDYLKNKHSDAGTLSNYPFFSVLSDKSARILYEFHDFRVLSLDIYPFGNIRIEGIG